MDKRELQATFQQHFNTPPEVVAHAPGRVNLIGEHTDYNQGFVFPAAINFVTWVAAGKRNDNQCCVVAADYEEQRNSFALDNIVRDSTQPWSNYARGVLKVLQQQYPLPGGINLVVTGNVPQGAGLSSSASFEIALLKAIAEVFELDIDGVTAALLGQRAENDFVGCACGIMDQLISAMGREDHAMLLDCRSLTFKHSTLPDNLHIVIVNSNVKRGLVDSEYNLRRQQCEQAAEWLGVTSLRDATLDMLGKHSSEMPDAVMRRARHIITENARTQLMFEALANNDIMAVSQAMAESHASMRDDFEITVPPIDYLVTLIAGVLEGAGGVRMTGGGFGGCVVALVPQHLIGNVKAAVTDHDYANTGYQPDIYDCTATQGAFA
ncbi:galactokinase [Alteromonas sp. ASW11-19]|uniref:Galactokinase n=1 Tax=Alteromonas salexigens TaxID=2982530 RepID=A0ABT2VN17_9ALTE|nr:galactokinase [Alteromonas salexigens]MCU7554705.1 galactokinase [Alteromonas salexigens]